VEKGKLTGKVCNISAHQRFAQYCGYLPCTGLCEQYMAKVFKHLISHVDYQCNAALVYYGRPADEKYRFTTSYQSQITYEELKKMLEQMNQTETVIKCLNDNGQFRGSTVTDGWKFAMENITFESPTLITFERSIDKAYLTYFGDE